MKRIVEDFAIIVKKEFQEYRHKPVLFVVPLFAIAPFIIVLILLSKRFQTVGASSVLPLFVNTLFTHYALSFFFVASFGVVISLFYKERLSKSLEALLVTPLGLHQIWLGKSLFLFLWGYCYSMIGVLTASLFLGLLSNMEGAIIFPGTASLFFFFCVFPLVALVATAFVGLVNLFSESAALSNMIFLMIGIGYMVLSSLKAEGMQVTWETIPHYLLVTLALGIFVLIWSRRLTKERVITSG